VHGGFSAASVSAGQKNGTAASRRAEGGVFGELEKDIDSLLKQAQSSFFGAGQSGGAAADARR
jgi:hypothetical protein